MLTPGVYDGKVVDAFWSESAKKGTPCIHFKVEIEGLADNTNRRAPEVIGAFEDSLCTSPFIGSAALLSQDLKPEPERNAFRFKVRVAGLPEADRGGG